MIFSRNNKLKRLILTTVLVVMVFGFSLGVVADANAQSEYSARQIFTILTEAGLGAGEAYFYLQTGQWRKLLHLDVESAKTLGADDKVADAVDGFLEPVVSSIENLVKGALAFIISIIIALEGGILVLFSKLLLILASYNGFIRAGVVQIGWTVVRDITNLFFVLILLAIAIATILRIESYNFKRQLPKLLLMAVLVNFSLVIAGVMIDFSQIIMLTFVTAFAASLGGDLLRALHIQDILSAAKNTFSLSSTPDPLTLPAVIVSGIFAIILLFVAIIAIGVILVVLLMRMVMLWLLLILAPLPYLLSAFPQGERYAQQWWQEFTKYIIYGPMIGFFLWVSLSVVSGQSGITPESLGDSNTVSQLAALKPSDLTGDASIGNTAFFTEIGQPASFLSFIIAIALLMGGLVITQQLGVAGSSLAGSAYSSIRQKGLAPIKFAASAGQAIAKAPFQYIGRKSNEAYAEGRSGPLGIGFFNVAARWRGYQQRREDLHGSAQTRATARGRDQMDRVFTGTDMGYATQVQLKQEAEFAKDFSSVLDKEEFAQKAVDLMSGGDNPESRSKKRALVRAAAEAGYLDDLMSHPEMREHVRTTADRMYTDGPQELRDYMDAPDEVSGLSLRQRMAQGEWNGYDQTHIFLQDYIGDTQEGLNTINALDEIAVKNRHPEYAGHSTFRSIVDGGRNQMEMETLYNQTFTDPETGQQRTRRSASNRAISEFFKWPGRQKMSVAPHGVYTFGQDDQGRFAIGQDRFGRQIFSGAFAGQAQRATEHSQNRMWTMIAGGTGDDTRWARDAGGVEMRTAEGDRIPEVGSSQTMQALAHYLQNVGGTGGTALWNKLGNEGANQVVMHNGNLVSFQDIVNSDPASWRGVGIPAAPYADVDMEKHGRTKQQLGAYEARGMSANDFYNSKDYTDNQNTYENREDFDRVEGVNAGWRLAAGRAAAQEGEKAEEALARMSEEDIEKTTKAEQGKVRGVQSAFSRTDDVKSTLDELEKREKAGTLDQTEMEGGRDPRKELERLRAEFAQTGLGVDFADQEVQKLFGVKKGMAGAFMNQEQLSGEQKQFLVSKYASQLKAEGQSDPAIEVLTGRLAQSLNNVESLRLTNNSGMVGRSETARHERAHLEIEKLSSQEIDEIYSSIEDGKRLEMEAEVKARWGNLDDTQVKKEILTQGLASYGRSDARGPLQIGDETARQLAATKKVKMRPGSSRRLEEYEQELTDQQAQVSVAPITRGELRKERSAAKQATRAQKKAYRQEERAIGPVVTQAYLELNKQLSTEQLDALWNESGLTNEQKQALEQDVLKSSEANRKSSPPDQYTMRLAALARGLARTQTQPGVKSNLHLNAGVLSDLKARGVNIERVGTKDKLYTQAQTARGNYQENLSQYEKVVDGRRETQEFFDEQLDSRRQQKADNDSFLQAANRRAEAAARSGDLVAARKARKEAQSHQAANKGLDKQINVIEKDKQSELSRQDKVVATAKVKMQSALDEVVKIEDTRRPETTKAKQSIHDASVAARSGNTQQQQQVIQQLTQQSDPQHVVAAAQEFIGQEGINLQEAIREGFGSAAIIEGLHGIETALSAVLTGFDKLPSGSVDAGAQATIERLIKATQGHRAENGSTLNASSTNGLLSDIRRSLRTVSGQLDNDTLGGSSEALEPQDTISK